MNVRITTHSMPNRTWLYTGVTSVWTRGPKTLVLYRPGRRESTLPLNQVALIQLDEAAGGLCGPVHD